MKQIKQFFLEGKSPNLIIRMFEGVYSAFSPVSNAFRLHDDLVKYFAVLVFVSATCRSKNIEMHSISPELLFVEYFIEHLN